MRIALYFVFGFLGAMLSDTIRSRDVQQYLPLRVAEFCNDLAITALLGSLTALTIALTSPSIQIESNIWNISQLAFLGIVLSWAALTLGTRTLTHKKLVPEMYFTGKCADAAASLGSSAAAMLVTSLLLSYSD